MDEITANRSLRKGRKITDLMTVESSKNGPFNGQGKSAGRQVWVVGFVSCQWEMTIQGTESQTEMCACVMSWFMWRFYWIGTVLPQIGSVVLFAEAVCPPETTKPHFGTKNTWISSAQVSDHLRFSHCWALKGPYLEPATPFGSVQLVFCLL
jgi:hypothetical protein